jgi:hypothetical protein
VHNPPRKLGDYANAPDAIKKQRRLLAVAQAQQGFFTTKQAIHAGFAAKTHAYHMRAGNWRREYRGAGEARQIQSEACARSDVRDESDTRCTGKNSNHPQRSGHGFLQHWLGSAASI